jgi:hypothetical protein
MIDPKKLGWACRESGSPVTNYSQCDQDPPLSIHTGNPEFLGEMKAVGTRRNGWRSTQGVSRRKRFGPGNVEWIEPAGVDHAVSRNQSEDKPANRAGGLSGCCRDEGALLCRRKPLGHDRGVREWSRIDRAIRWRPRVLVRQEAKAMVTRSLRAKACWASRVDLPALLIGILPNRAGDCVEGQRLSRLR